MLTSGSRGRRWPSKQRVAKTGLSCARVSVLSGPRRRPGSRGRASYRMEGAWGEWAVRAQSKALTRDLRVEE